MELAIADIRRRQVGKAVSLGEFNPMNDVLFKFLFGTPQRKMYTIDFSQRRAAQRA